MGFVHINGGTLDLTAETDGIQAVTEVAVNGGVLRIAAGDDGISSLNAVNIMGGEVYVADSMEGIESVNATISGGSVVIRARNDGINARSDAPGANVFIRMNGGEVAILSQGDSIESDGNIYLAGGTMHVSGGIGTIPSGNVIITGTDFIYAGNHVNVSPESTQPVIIASFGTAQPTGSVVEFRDSNGNVITSYTALQPFASSVFSSSGFTIGGVYFVYINGERELEVTLSAVITNL
jgi:hypothetical protein